MVNYVSIRLMSAGAVLPFVAYYCISPPKLISPFILITFACPEVCFSILVSSIKAALFIGVK